MSSTYTALYYHLVFSTKNRAPYIRADVKPRLHAYLAGTVKHLDGLSYEIGGVEDHVHLLIRLTQHHVVKDFVRELKKSTSGWVHKDLDMPEFAWQEGYAIFTVSPFEQMKIKEYIRNQERHHSKRTYIDELKWMLERAKIAYDPKYLE